MDADVLITEHFPLVRNDFAFRGTPKIMWFPYLSDYQLSELCKQWKVAPVPREILNTISIGDTSTELELGSLLEDHENALARLDAADCK